MIESQRTPIRKETYAAFGMYGYQNHPKIPLASIEYFRAPLMRRFMGLVEEDEGVVLDLGGGIGYETLVLRKSLKRETVFSIDISSMGARQAHKNAPGSSVQANFLSVPVARESILAVHAKDNFIHIPQKEDFFDEMQRILRPGGLLFISSAQISHEVRTQFAWGVGQIKKIARKRGIKLLDWGKVLPHSDEWYLDEVVQTPKFHLLFQKVERRPPYLMRLLHSVLLEAVK